MEEVKSGTRFSLSKVVAVILAAVLLFGGVVYFYKSTTTTTTTKATYKVAGSGSASFALKFWTKKFEEQNLQATVEFIPSADAAIAFLGVVEKTIDIGASSRLPKPEEENPLLVITPFATDAIVLAVNKSVVGVTNLTKEDIIGIWSGAITNWKQIGGPDAKIILVDREEAESSKKKLRELYLGDAKITPNAIEVHSEGDVDKTVGSTQNSIGMLSNGRVKINSNLIALKLNSVGVDDVDSGAYPYVRKFYVVTRKDSSEEVNSFMKFITASNNQGLYREFGFYKP